MKAIIAITALFTVAACQSTPEGGPSLNQGKKWQVNEEMKPHIERAENILLDYLAEKDTDHLALATRLKNQNDRLIKSCTMEGPGHDELHHWLHPHMNLIKKLAETDDATQAAAIVSELATSFATYHQYFQ